MPWGPVCKVRFARVGDYLMRISIEENGGAQWAVTRQPPQSPVGAADTEEEAMHQAMVALSGMMTRHEIAARSEGNLARAMWEKLREMQYGVEE